MQSFKLFFARNPSLFYALFAVLGVTAYLEEAWLWSIFLGSILSGLCISWKRTILGWCVLLAAFFFTMRAIQFTPIPENGIEGFAWVRIDNISYQTHFHKSGWAYKGRIQGFWVENNHYAIKGIPFLASLADSPEARPSANYDYLVKCRLLPGHGKKVFLKPAARTPWEPIKKNFSFAEERFWAKHKVKEWIANHYSSSIASTFLAGLIIGEFDDAQLKQDFGRFGLLHLLAISGFHFGILASLLNQLLRMVLPPRLLSFALIGILSGYFFFLGWGPSVVRAWMTIILFYSAFSSRRRSFPINSLGVAVLFAQLIDPLLIENLGFQFSVVTTAAILLLNKPCQELIEGCSEKREFREVAQWPSAHQIAYLILGFLKNNLALCIATSLVAIPISLYYFQYFPLLSLVYNAFFPLLVSFCMIFLIIGTLLMPLYIGTWVHRFNDSFTSFLLNMTYDIPSSWDWKIQTPELPCSIVITFLIFIFLINIYFQKLEKQLQL